MLTSNFKVRRKELFLRNQQAWYEGPLLETASRLDSSLKKNTAFIKKVRTFSKEQSQSLLDDVRTLSLEKYLSEIILSIGEGLLKLNTNSEITVCAEVVSALHQRFTVSFTPYLLSNLLTNLGNPINFENEQESEKDDLFLLRRNIFRIAVEFYLLGLFTTVKDCDKNSLSDNITKKYFKYSDEPVILLLLKDMTYSDLKLDCSARLIESFLQRFHLVFFKASDGLVSPEVANKVEYILKKYMQIVSEKAIQLYNSTKRLELQNKKASIRTGKIPDDINDELKYNTEKFFKFFNAASSLAKACNFEMFQLPKEDSENASEGLVKGRVTNENDVGCWGNVREKNFYTKFPVVEVKEVSDLNEKSAGEKINYFINKLENLTNESDVDSLARDFVKLDLNNKATRKRLMKFFIEVASIDSLKFYARLLKINENILKDTIDDLVNYLDKGFRSQIFGNTINFKNIFFFCELIKFKLVPTHIIFHKIRKLTMEISVTNNIDILYVFYEQCGRFLLQEPDYRDLTKEMLDLLKQKLKSEAVSANEKLAIGNLVNIVVPPPTKISKLQDEKTLSPEQQFIVRLVHYELSTETRKVIYHILKNLDFDDQIIGSTLVEVLSSPEQLNYDNIENMGTLLLNLSRQDKSLSVKVIDAVIEKVVGGLELNDYRLNRERLSHMKYMSVFFNLKLVKFETINNLLYSILCLGHPNGSIIHQDNVDLDLPDNYFRIQLCCVLLLNINVALIKEKRNKHQLAVFLLFFQLYYYTKKQPIPSDIEFKLHDLFLKYSLIGVNRLANLMEVAAALQELDQTERHTGSLENDVIETSKPEEDDAEEEDIGEDGESNIDDNEEDDDEDNEDDSSEDDVTDDDNYNGEEDEGYEESEKGTDLDVDGSETNSDQEDTEDAIRKDDFRDGLSNDEKKFTDDLDKEFQKIVIDSFNQNSSSTHKKFHIPTPPQTNTARNVSDNKIKFGLLTRGGKKNNYREVNMPTNTKIAESLIKEQENQKNYKERNRNLILNMNN